MPLNSAGIFYANENTDMSVGGILAALASSASNSIGALQTVTAKGTGSVSYDYTSTPTYLNSGIVASIVPSNVDTKIVVSASISFSTDSTAASGYFGEFELRRNNQAIAHFVDQTSLISRGAITLGAASVLSVCVIDTPSYAGKCEYTVWGKTLTGAYSNLVFNGASSSIVLLEITA